MRSNKIKNIVFVCRYNVFRSRVAEAYFKKQLRKYKIKGFRVRSAGVMKAEETYSAQVKVAKSMGLDIRGRPKDLGVKLMNWQDTLVIVADDIPIKFYSDDQKKNSKSIIVWKIGDVKNNVGGKKTESIIKEIIKKVDNLIGELK